MSSIFTTFVAEKCAWNDVRRHILDAMTTKLFLQALTKFLVGLLLFLPAGTFDYPQAHIEVFQGMNHGQLLINHPKKIAKRITEMV